MPSKKVNDYTPDSCKECNHLSRDIGFECYDCGIVGVRLASDLKPPSTCPYKVKAGWDWDFILGVEHRGEAQGEKRQQLPLSIEWKCKHCGHISMHDYRKGAGWYLSEPTLPGAFEEEFWCDECGECSGKRTLHVDFVIKVELS